MWQELTLHTRQRAEWVDIRAQVQQAVSASGVRDGLCLVYSPHTTAGMHLFQRPH